MNLKMSTVTQKTFKLLGTHALNAFICLVLVLMFSHITTKAWGAATYTVIVVFFSVVNLYTLAWDIAKKDMRNIKIYNNHLPEGKATKVLNPADGFYSAILITVVNFVLFTAYAVGFNLDGTAKMLTTFIFRAWQSPYILLLSRNGEANLLTAAVVCLVPVVFYSLGYFMGIKDMGRFDDLLYKLVYKSNKKNGKK